MFAGPVRLRATGKDWGTRLGADATAPRLSNGTSLHVIYLPGGMARRYEKGELQAGRDPQALRTNIAEDLPPTWRRDQDPQPSVLAPYQSYADLTPPAIVTSSPLAVLFDAPTPAPAEPSDDVGVELLHAVGPAAGLDDPRHFAPLPPDAAAAVLTELDLTHEDGRPVRPRELLEDGTQLFAADGTAVSWARSEDGLRRLAESLGGHLASVSEGWPEP